MKLKVYQYKQIEVEQLNLDQILEPGDLCWIHVNRKLDTKALTILKTDIGLTVRDCLKRKTPTLQPKIRYGRPIKESNE